MSSPPDGNSARRSQVLVATTSYGGCSQLRLEIRSQAVSESGSFARPREFYPSNKLRNIITREKILEVLKCSCTDCNRRTEFPRNINVVQKLTDEILSVRNIPSVNHNDALHIFALMTCIECPQLIAPLLRMHQHGQLPDSLEGLSVDFLQQAAWPQFDRRHPKESIAFAKDFNRHKYKFSVASITNDYQEFNENTILPFINERPLDEGGFGRVCSFEISDGYRDNLWPEDVRRFARKELHNSILGRFRTERDNLELISQLADPHLIKIVKAYKHGDCFNFIFPCARSNLDKYLRYPKLWSPAMHSEQIQSHWFWTQMLGLAGAVRKIHSFRLTSQSGVSELYGYHFDIKPANILVMDNGLFVVSDFGQASFKERDRGTSRITGMGGTEAYAPPEFDERNSRPNRKYDVWSLGCVFLEICTFIVLGYDGVNQLDALKLSLSEDGYCEYESFHEKSGDANSNRLKRTISSWIETLPDSEAVQDEEGRKFLVEILELVSRMLEVEVAKRLASEEVFNEMKRILGPYLFDDTTEPNQNIREFLLPPDDVELRPDITPTIHGLVCSIGNDQFTGPIRISETLQGDIKVFNVLDDHLVSRGLGKKKNLFLTPQYAFTHENLSSHSGSHMVLESTESDLTQQTLSLRINFRDIRKAAVLQCVILSQEVKRNLRLNSIVLSTQESHGIKKLLRPKQKHPTESIDGGYVQLWLATPGQLVNTIQHTPLRRRSTRGSQSFIDSPIAKRRIVIFCANAIYTIFFSKAVRLARREVNGNSLSLHIVPTNELATPSFTVSKITSSTRDKAPAIPVDRDEFELREGEKTSCLQCKSIALTFQCPADVDLFWDAYISMKQAWKRENALFESVNRGVG